MEREAIAVSAVLLLCGCYSTSLRGDAHADGTSDTGVDTSVDTGVPPDAPPDVAVDTVPACPEPTAPDIGFRVGLDPETTPHDILWLCTVEGISVGSDGSLHYQLLCLLEDGMERTVDIDITAEPTPNIIIDPYEEVFLRYVANSFWWENRWLMVEDPMGNMIFGAVDAASLAPLGLSPDDWYDPLDVSRRTGICPPEPTDCGEFERQAVDVFHEGMGRHFFDHSTGTIVHTEELAHVHVGTLTGFTDMECDDIPDTWTNALFAMQVRF